MSATDDHLSTIAMSDERVLRYGMVGGGPGAFIGAVHRRAAAFDGRAVLAAGAFSSRPDASRAMGAELGLPPARAYPSWEAMLAGELDLPPEERIQLVSVVTPNASHFPIASAFAERGFHVMCEKPLTVTVEEAERLRKVVRANGVVFALAHTYAGYPMVRQARALVRAGVLGELRRVDVSYAQGWLAEAIERDGQKQAAWRTDPALAGAGALGDIGTHAAHLARFVTGLEIEWVLADVRTVVEGRLVDDDASILLRFRGGARGTLTASQVMAGEENDLRLRVAGSRATLEWRHDEPNLLRVRHADRPMETYTRGGAGIDAAASRATRLPSGHPEGYAEAFATLYAGVIRLVHARLAGVEPHPLDLEIPGIDDGVAGMRFIRAALRSAAEGGWAAP